MPDPKQPQPLERLFKIFTPEKFDVFLCDLEEICEYGYGAVMVEFDNHEAQRVKPTKYRIFPKDKNYKAE